MKSMRKVKSQVIQLLMTVTVFMKASTEDSDMRMGCDVVESGEANGFHSLTFADMENRRNSGGGRPLYWHQLSQESRKPTRKSLHWATQGW